MVRENNAGAGEWTGEKNNGRRRMVEESGEPVIIEDTVKSKLQYLK